MNLTDKDRVAILNACIPGWIVPMGDQSDVYTQMVRACPMPLSPCLLGQPLCLASEQRGESAERFSLSAPCLLIWPS